MQRIGIIGAQSMHVVHFGDILANGMLGVAARAYCLWPLDAPEMAAQRMAVSDIPVQCETLEELLQRCDVVLLLLRDGNTHRLLAEECLRQGKPVFVDKPFACTREDAAAMLRCAEETGTFLDGGSTLCWLPETLRVARLVAQARELHIHFSADPASPYGGWFFFGSHLTDLCAAIAGCDAGGAEVSVSGRQVHVVVQYDGLDVHLHSRPDCEALTYEICLKNGEKERLVVTGIERCYRLALEAFFKAMRTGSTANRERLLFSTRLLAKTVQNLPGDHRERARFML